MTDRSEVERLSAFLHARRMHPDYEYDTTRGPRKAFDEHPPPGDGWVRNIAVGDQGWERFDFYEEAYWMRRLPQPTVDADNIEDWQIIRLGRTFRDGTATDAIARDTVMVALGLSLQPPEVVRDARAKLAAFWNRLNPPAPR